MRAFGLVSRLAPALLRSLLFRLPAAHAGRIEEMTATGMADGLPILYSGDYAYTLEGDEATIVGHSGSSFAWDREAYFPPYEPPADPEAFTWNVLEIPARLDGQATINGYTGAEVTSLAIPETLDGHPVTGVLQTYDQYTFQGRDFVSVTLPEGVVLLGPEVFAGCYALESAALPRSLTLVDASAFLTSDQVTLTVHPGSYAEEYARTYEIAYAYYPGE